MDFEVKIMFLELNIFKDGKIKLINTAVVSNNFINK